MDNFDEFDGEEEEVDYDFNLDDEFLNEGLEGEKDTAAAEGKKGTETPGVASEQKAPAEQPRQAAQALQKPAAEAARHPQVAEKEAPAASGSGRRRVPIPIPKPAGTAADRSVTRTAPPSADKGMARGVPPANGRTQQGPGQRQRGQMPPSPGSFEHRGQNPAGSGGGFPLGRMDGRGDQGGFVDGQVQRPPPGGRLGWPQAAPRMGGGMLNGVPNGPGMRPRLSQAMGLGVPMLPMPPGLPMPGMDMPMPPATSLGSLIPGGSRRGGDENVARLAGRMEREGPHPLRQVMDRAGRHEPERSAPSTAQGFANRFPSMKQYAARDLGPGGGMALGHGMPDARQDQEGRLDRRAPPEESKKRIWERLGPVPQLAGEFEASDEFEPPRKVLSADTLGRANRRDLSGRLQPGFRMPPMMMQQPAPPPVKDPVAEAAERAKKEAEAQRLADIQKQIKAQKLENSLLAKMRELKKKEQIAALQEQIARLEAAERSRAAAAAARAAAAQKKAVAQELKSVVEAAKPEPVAKQPPPLREAPPTRSKAAPVQKAQPLTKAAAQTRQPVKSAAVYDDEDGEEIEPVVKPTSRLRSVIATACGSEEAQSSSAVRRSLPANARVERDRHSPQDDWEEQPGKKTDLRTFLSQQRAKKRGTAAAEPEVGKKKRPAFGQPFRPSRDA